MSCVTKLHMLQVWPMNMCHPLFYFLYLIFSPFSLFSFQVLIRLQSSMSFLLVSLLILSSYLYLNIVEIQAHWEDLVAIPYFRVWFRNLRVTENRKTILLQFNGILFKSSLSCSKQDERLYPFTEDVKVILNIQTQEQVFMGGIL